MKLLEPNLLDLELRKAAKAKVPVTLELPFDSDEAAEIFDALSEAAGEAFWLDDVLVDLVTAEYDPGEDVVTILLDVLSIN